VQAKKALDALPVVWDEAGNGSKSSATIAEMLKDGLNASTTNGDRKNGDALRQSGKLRPGSTRSIQRRSSRTPVWR